MNNDAWNDFLQIPAKLNIKIIWKYAIIAPPLTELNFNVKVSVKIVTLPV